MDERVGDILNQIGVGVNDAAEAVAAEASSAASELGGSSWAWVLFAAAVAFVAWKLYQRYWGTSKAKEE